MYKDWLKRKVSIKQAEKENMVRHRQLGWRKIPFGFQNNEWKQFISEMKVDDELWEFCSPEETWENLCGREGLALVRNGEIINFIVTSLN